MANGSGSYAVVVTTTCGTATSDSVVVNVTTLTASVTRQGLEMNVQDRADSRQQHKLSYQCRKTELIVRSNRFNLV
ncbi:MAG: hypothetical protein R2847_10600 [Bacteroidia bacterium]